MSYSQATAPSNFIMVNSLYNVKPLVGLPTQNLKQIETTGAKYNSYLTQTGPWAENVFPATTNAPYATTNYMTLSTFIKGYEQGTVGKVSVPQ